MENRTKTVEICKVMPSSSPDTHPLTFFDIRWLRLPPVQRLYFYELSAPPASFYSYVLPRLKQSLSAALSHFPLSGNLIWPESSLEPVVVREESDGISLTVAESGDDFFHLSGCSDKVFVDVKACHPLISSLAESKEKAELSSLQITLFPNAGVSIGISTHHAIVDGKTSTSFMKSWAHIFRLGGGGGGGSSLPSELKPFLNKTIVKDPAKLRETFARQWLNLDGGPNNRSLKSWTTIRAPPGSVRATFTLSRADITKLRQSVGSSSGTLRLSTFCLAYAYTVVCEVKAEGIESGELKLIINFDCRSRLDPALPETYFGNCIGSLVLVLDPKIVGGKDGLAAAAKAIGEAVASLEEWNLNGTEFWVSGLISAFTAPDDGSSTCYAVAGSTRFEVYGTDFGWGRPRKVDIVSTDSSRAVGFSDSRDVDGGVEIALVRKKDVVEAFASLFAKGLE